MSSRLDFSRVKAHPSKLGKAIAHSVWGSERVGQWPKDTVLLLDIDRTVVDEDEQSYADRGDLLHRVIKAAEAQGRFAYLTARPCTERSVAHTQKVIKGHGLGNTGDTGQPSCSVHGSSLTSGRRVCSCMGSDASVPITFTGGACKGAAASVFLQQRYGKRVPPNVIFADDQPGYLRDVQIGLRYESQRKLHLIHMVE